MGGVVTHNLSVAQKIAKSFSMSEDDFYLGAASTPKGSGTSPYNTGDIAALQSGIITTSQFWENFSKRTGIKVDGDPWANFFEPVQDPETYRIISDLKKAGFRVVCGTNTLDAHYNSHVAHDDYHCFDKVYASHLIHLIKPHPEFWLHILKEERVEPNEAFFTDYAEENIIAAEKLGISVHHFKNALGLRKALSDFI
jgi:putative hydrolase of the HAD superfamily